MAETIQYNIGVPETYEKDGEEKTAWTTLGMALVKDSCSISLNLPEKYRGVGEGSAISKR